MNYGDLHRVELPDRGGREQRGRRPAVIWQDMEAFGVLPTVLVLPLTHRKGIAEAAVRHGPETSQRRVAVQLGIEVLEA